MIIQHYDFAVASGRTRVYRRRDVFRLLHRRGARPAGRHARGASPIELEPEARRSAFAYPGSAPFPDRCCGWSTGSIPRCPTAARTAWAFIRGSKDVDPDGVVLQGPFPSAIRSGPVRWGWNHSSNSLTSPPSTVGAERTGLRVAGARGPHRWTYRGPDRAGRSHVTVERE